MGTRSCPEKRHGTPREQAELLVALLGEAGFEAFVVQGRLDPSRAADLTTPPPSLSFAPVVEEARVNEWLEKLGSAGDAEYSAFDEDGRLAAAIASQVFDGLPAGLAAPPFDSTLDLVPLVGLIDGGTTVYLNPLVQGAEFGQSYADDLNQAPPPFQPGDIEVALQVAMSPNPGVRHTLVEGAWPLTGLIGRRIVARLIPEGDPDLTLVTPADQLRTFSSILMVEDPRAPREELEALTLLGSSVTIGGDLLVATEDGLTVNEVPFDAEPGIESQIAALEVGVAADAFPLIRLRVRAVDASGAPVLGAPAEAFAIEEDGTGRAFTLRQTRPPAPRVLLLLDTSGSIPPEFIGEQLAEFGRAVVQAVQADFPSAEFRVAGLALGTAATAHLWTTDPEEVALEAGRAVGYGSEFWAGAGDAGLLGANVIVLVTDGQSTDLEEDIALARPQIAAGPPVVSILVGEPDTSAPQAIADLSGGAVYDAVDRDQAIASLLVHLSARDLEPLEFQYEAPSDGSSVRTVLLTTSAAAAEASYEVPSFADRLEPPSVAGIYLAVRFGGREVLRTLAGVPAESATAQTVIDTATRLEVRAALLGSAVLSIEGGAPTFGAWLDDVLSARLTWEPLLKAAATGSREHVLEAIKSGFRTVPSELMLLHAPSGDPATFEVSPRMVLLARRPSWEGMDVTRADILPFTRFATQGEDRAAAFRTTVEQTARLAAVEQHLYRDSTSLRLAERPTEYLPVGGVASREGPLAPWAWVIDHHALSHRLLPREAGQFAFWVVDEGGSLLGILPDGSGGGISEKEAEAACKAINQGAALADLGGAWLGLPGAVGGFLALQKAIIKQYIKQAAKVSAIGGGALPDVAGCGGPGDFPCDVAKDALFGKLPGGSYLGGYDKVVAAATGDDAFNC